MKQTQPKTQKQINITIRKQQKQIKNRTHNNKYNNYYNIKRLTENK